MSDRCPTIGIEIMGGDRPPLALCQKLVQLLINCPKAMHLVFFGSSDTLEHIPSSVGNVTISTYPTSDVIRMGDDPIRAVKEKENASLTIAMKMLHKGELDAVVSNGSTGAITVCAKLILNMLKEVLRPALLTNIPTSEGNICLLDVGANTICRPEHLYQFAMMGLAYKRAFGVLRPTIGILNIGSEKYKGKREYRILYEQLDIYSRSLDNDYQMFIGNIEPNDVIHGRCDIVISEGFIGNMFLKTVEAVSNLIFQGLHKYDTDQSKPVHLAIKHFNQSIGNHLTPGALFIGLEGIVMKCHGNADAEHILESILEVNKLLHNGFLQAISNLL